MTDKQLNRYADLVLVCKGDRRYGGEITLADNVLVGVLAGELKVVQAGSTRHAAAGDALLLPRNQPATLLKAPKNGVAYQAVILTLPSALVRAYYAQHPPAAAPPAAFEALLFPSNPLLQSLFDSLLPYLELRQPLPE